MSSEQHDVTGLDLLDPAANAARDAVHFRRILAARQRIAAAEQEMRDAVKAARDAGDSWTMIAAALDTTPSGGAAAFRRQLSDPRWVSVLSVSSCPPA